MNPKKHNIQLMLFKQIGVTIGVYCVDTQYKPKMSGNYFIKSQVLFCKTLDMIFFYNHGLRPIDKYESLCMTNSNGSFVYQLHFS